MLMNMGDEIIQSDNLLTTINYVVDGKPTYALEGSIFIAGAVVQWLRDGLKIIEKASDSEELAPAMRQHAGDTRAGDLRRCRCGRHGRWDAIEDQQGSGQEPAAHTEQSGKNARQSSQRDDPQSIYGQVRDWEIDIHALALSQRGDGWKPDYVRSRSKASERHHFPALHCQQHARGSLLPDARAPPRWRD